MKKALILILALALLCGTALAQSFEDDLKKLAEENAKMYMEPFSTAFGSTMNAGLYHTAKPHKLLGFDISIKAMMAMVPDDGKSFTFQMPQEIPLDAASIPGLSSDITLNANNIYNPFDLETPTVFGEDTLRDFQAEFLLLKQEIAAQLGVPVSSVSDALVNEVLPYTRIVLPPGVNLDYLPLPLAQVSVGLPRQTEVLLRLIPKTEIHEDVGELSLLGIGVKHSVSQYFPMFPVDVAAQFAYQKLEVGDIVTSTHTCFSLIASKKFFIITPYVGLGMESSNIEIDYTIEYPENPSLDGTEVKFDLEGDNGFRARAGFSLTFFPLLKLTADYGIGNYNVATLGLSLSLR